MFAWTEDGGGGYNDEGCMTQNAIIERRLMIWQTASTHTIPLMQCSISFHGEGFWMNLLN